MYIEHYLNWQNNSLSRDGNLLLQLSDTLVPDIPLRVYEQAGISYPKFFKMDLLSRVAFLATELLAPDVRATDKSKVAVALGSASGCIDVDKKYDESRKTLASPALFVYTLPNIMLGEICIRQGFKGEQVTTISEQPDIDWLQFYVEDLLRYRHASACLAGHVEATATAIRATLLWISPSRQSSAATGFERSALERIFQ
ncbi:hypothetical protein [Taibaiella chishuiensis]|uniref:Beta-ketoacyl synthase-like protein n=1 Tax=Taibaiella chishuiensis TaxID=1434707 RepID=A0A2P8D3Z5_9BACT|nr:hypothetical protein [Taibaiella chishuiensis]PSK91935.1 hypothetical protein B0I18_10429 [Taibaiella chishuiensis]